MILFSIVLACVSAVVICIPRNLFYMLDRLFNINYITNRFKSIESLKQMCRCVIVEFITKANEKW